ncbi:hypothetical protein ACT18_24760, partial [Mycolicibacter kumamotonensis]
MAALVVLVVLVVRRCMVWPVLMVLVASVVMVVLVARRAVVAMVVLVRVVVPGRRLVPAVGVVVRRGRLRVLVVPGVRVVLVVWGRRRRVLLVWTAPWATVAMVVLVATGKSSRMARCRPVAAV